MSAEELLGKLRAEVVKPDATSAQRIDSYLLTLNQLQNVSAVSRTECLLAAAQFFYLSGNVTKGLAPSADAVTHARAGEAKPLLRKALTFHGVLQNDSGNFPVAIESLSEALELAIELNDKPGELAVWTNIGLGLMYAAQYEESIECSERALAVARSEPSLAQFCTASLCNIALAALHREDLARGLKAAKAGVDGSSDPVNASEAFIRVQTEAVYSRLLLEVDSLVKAKERCELAKKFAKQSGSERAELSAAIAEGLYEVHAGLRDVGLSRLEKALDRARGIKGILRDVLVSVVKGYEAAGEPEKALSYLRELMLHTRQAQQENVLYHHRLHLERLEDE
ncbi:MAG: tetratricopeptide repeat protein, partial [Burkholderiaceae bacterium]